MDQVSVASETDPRQLPTADPTTSGPAVREGDDAFLLAWSDAVRFQGDPHAVLAETTARLGRRLGATRVNYAEVDAGGEALKVEGDWTDGVASVAGGVFPLDALGEAVIADHLRGRPFLTADFHADPRAGAAQRALYDSVGVRAALTVPLVKQGRFLAVLSVQQARPRAWTGAEVRLVQELAERTWAVLERARAEAELARLRERRHQGDKSAALDRLLSGIGHELNNPLAIIAAQAALLQRTPEGADTARRAALIAEAAQRCGQVVQTFLTIARRSSFDPLSPDLDAAVANRPQADRFAAEGRRRTSAPWRTAWVQGASPDLVERLEAEGLACAPPPDGAAPSREVPDLVVGVLTGSGQDGPALVGRLTAYDQRLLDRLMFVVEKDAGASTVRFLQRARRPFLHRPFSTGELREALREVEAGRVRTDGAAAP